MAAVKKEDLLRRRCPEDDVELPSGGTVRVRGLTRGEIKAISDGSNEGKNMEPWSMSLVMLTPTLTEEEAAVWLVDGNFEDVARVQQRINELSGIAGLSQKEAYKSPGD